jgi:hypothetical protein
MSSFVSPQCSLFQSIALRHEFIKHNAAPSAPTIVEFVCAASSSTATFKFFLPTSASTIEFFYASSTSAFV